MSNTPWLSPILPRAYTIPQEDEEFLFLIWTIRNLPITTTNLTWTSYITCSLYQITSYLRPLQPHLARMSKVFLLLTQMRSSGIICPNGGPSSNLLFVGPVTCSHNWVRAVSPSSSQAEIRGSVALARPTMAKTPRDFYPFSQPLVLSSPP